MGWIKRNLYFTILGVIALIGLVAAIYYNIKGWSDNHKALEQVSDAYTQLQQAYNATPSPSETNIAAAGIQKQQLLDWITKAREHFVAVPPIPSPANGVVTTEAFAGNLRKTIHDMQVAAADANVELPDNYSFSFAAEANLVTFSPGSLDALAARLGQVKALCDIMFDAKINGIDSIQREVVSDNDTAGPQSDYLAEKTKTVDGAAITPYAITFRCFSGDLGNVLSKLASSNQGFIVTGINVMPAGGVVGPGGAGGPGMLGGPGMQPPVATPAQSGALQTVLDEQLLRVTLGIEVVTLTK